MKTDNIVEEKSKAFAIRIVKLNKYLRETKKEYVLSDQVLRSGTSIGANVSEANCAQTKADFYSKLSIAYKEAAETKYWLELLYAGEYIEKTHFDSIISDCKELIKLLAAITKTQKQ